MNLTPKEKAEELVEKCDGYVCYAEVAVDEILSIELIKESVDDYYLRFWQQVKQELEKL
jgi:hypothetical protein